MVFYRRYQHAFPVIFNFCLSMYKTFSTSLISKEHTHLKCLRHKWIWPFVSYMWSHRYWLIDLFTSYCDSVLLDFLPEIARFPSRMLDFAYVWHLEKIFFYWDKILKCSRMANKHMMWRRFLGVRARACVCTKSIQKCAAITAAKLVSGPINYEPNHTTVSLDRIIEPFTADVTVTSRH